jgi:peptidyl-prolyl cis-trans isomerase D
MIFQKLRKSMRAILIVIAALVIPAFLLWGPAPIGRRREYVGEISGQKISIEEYQNSLFAVELELRLLYGEGYERIRRFLNVEELAWDRLILLREAKRLAIEASDEEVMEHIQQYPFFQDEQGRFDPDRYQRVLRYGLRISPSVFENTIRDSIILEKLRHRVLAGVTVSDEEIRDEFIRRTQRVKAVFIIADEDLLRQKVSVIEEEIQKYYNEHKEQFMAPAQVSVDYISIEIQDMMHKIMISDESVERFYKRHREEFRKPDNREETDKEYFSLEEVREKIVQQLSQQEAARIARSIASKISIEIIEREEAGQGVDLLKYIAKKHGLTVNRSGFFTEETLVAELGYVENLGAIAFSLRQGQISDMIRTPKGYSFVRLREKKPPYPQELEDVRERIKEIIIANKASSLSKQTSVEMLEKFRAQLLMGKTVDEVASQLAIQPIRPEPFLRGEYIDGIGGATEQIAALFDLKKGELSGVLRLHKGYGFAYVEDIISGTEEEFERTKDEYRSFVLMRKKQERFSDWFERLREQARRTRN